MSAKYKAKGVVRSAKNFTKGYSDLEIKVRDVTSNDPRNPSGLIMQQIAAASHNSHQFPDVMMILDKRLNDKGKNWRHVHKALILLDFLLHAGNEATIQYAQENIPYIRTLLQFQYVDDANLDRGIVVRTKSKEIIDLLENGQERLRQDRASVNLDSFIHKRFADYFTANAQDYQAEAGRASSSSAPSYSMSPATDLDDADPDLRRALELSRAEANNKKNYRPSGDEQEDHDLRRALELSRQEAERVARTNNSRGLQPSGTMNDLLDLYEGPPVAPDAQFATPNRSYYQQTTNQPYYDQAMFANEYSSRQHNPVQNAPFFNPTYEAPEVPSEYQSWPSQGMGSSQVPYQEPYNDVQHAYYTMPMTTMNQAPLVDYSGQMNNIAPSSGFFLPNASSQAPTSKSPGDPFAELTQRAIHTTKQSKSKTMNGGDPSGTTFSGPEGHHFFGDSQSIQKNLHAVGDTRDGSALKPSIPVNAVPTPLVLSGNTSNTSSMPSTGSMNPLPTTATQDHYSNRSMTQSNYSTATESATAPNYSFASSSEQPMDALFPSYSQAPHNPMMSSTHPPNFFQ